MSDDRAGDARRDRQASTRGGSDGSQSAADAPTAAGDASSRTDATAPGRGSDARHVMRYAARSDRGLIRATNQDSVFAGNRLLVIADGMGGHAAGDTASRLVVAAFAPLNAGPPAPDLLSDLLEAAREGNDAIADVVADNPELDGMGTTVTALLFDGDRVGVAHVGDSRAYLYRSGVLHQLTHDDTFVQSLVDDGRITEAEASHHPQRNLLLRALNGTDLDPSLALREVRAGDRYLLCSDGLHGVVGAEAIADTLADPDPERAADTLIQRALLRGGPDNVTVIVADVIDTGVAPMPGPVTVTTDNADPDATGPIQQMTREMPRVPLPPIPEEPGARPEYLPDGDDGDEDDGDEDEDDGGFDGDDDFSGGGFAGDDFAGEDATDTHDDEYHEIGLGARDGDDRTGVDDGGDGTDADADRADGSAETRSAAHGSGPSAGNGGARTGRRAQAGQRAERRRWHRRGALTLAIVALVLVALAGSTLWVRSQYYVGANGDTVAVFRGVNGSLLGVGFASFQEDSCAGKTDCSPIKMNDLQPAARNQVLAGIPASSLADARGVMDRLSGQLLPPCPAPAVTTPPDGASTAASDSSPTTLAATEGAGTVTGASGAGGTSTNGTTAASRASATGTAPATGTPAGEGGAATTGGRAAPSTPAKSPAARPATKQQSAPQQGAPAQGANTTATGRAGLATLAGGTAAGSTGGRLVVTVEPAPITRTMLTTVTGLPPGLFGAALGGALQEAAPTTHDTATGSGRTTHDTRGTGAKEPSTTRTTVTDTTPMVTITQTVTASPTVTATPLAPAPAVPGVNCRTVP